VQVNGKRGDIADSSLTEEGLRLIEWAGREMPVLQSLKDRFAKEKPLKGIRIAGCLHVTSETANLALVLKEGGALVTMCASNPLSTQDPIAAALTIACDIPTFAIKGENTDTYYSHINATLDNEPQMTMDDGADLVAEIHTKRTSLLNSIIGGTEETTTGVIRLRSMAANGDLKYPIIAVNEASTKHLFDNRYGTGQSTLDGITRATNVLWAGKKVVVAGYGWCGKGVAKRADGMGGNVIVTEIDSIRALEAVMDGYLVMTMEQASTVGDIFITITGGLNTIDKAHFQAMKSGAIMANSGHFNAEINIPALESVATSRRKVRNMVEEYTMPDGRRLYLLAEGRLVNLSAAEGHPSAVMDMSFANQAISAEYIAINSKNLSPGVYGVPQELDAEVGRLKLAAMGIRIDTLTPEQDKYLNSWDVGTT
jgi:adenosylhomocysteinase